MIRYTSRKRPDKKAEKMEVRNRRKRDRESERNRNRIGLAVFPLPWQ